MILQAIDHGLLEKPRLGIMWIESIIISILFPITGYVIDSSDPFFINYKFPWLIFAPLLISLRYGFMCGMMSASLLIGMITLVFYMKWFEIISFPEEMVIGLLLVTIIAAEFQGIWFRKSKLFEDKYNYIKVRMEEFARVYHLLKGSHNQLEQLLAANQGKSLRSSLIDLERQVLSLEKINGDPLEGIGEEILKLFGDYANVQMAALYTVKEQRKISTRPVACLGHPSPLWTADPLLRECLRTGHVASINMVNDDAMNAAGTLVVIPLVDVYHKVWGLVTIHEMPLFAFHENTMDLFAVLGGHIGDLVKRRAESCCYVNDHKDDFEKGLHRIFEEIKHLRTSAVVIATIIKNQDLQNKFLARFQTELRGADKIWIIKDSQGYPVFLKLLHLTSESGANEFLVRLGLLKSSAEKFSHVLDSNDKTFSHCCGEDIIVNSWTLDEKVSIEQVLLEINQFSKQRLVDFQSTGNKNENISVSM